MPANPADLTHALFQAILDHWWQARRERAPREPKLYPAGYLISYATLIQRAAVVAEARRLGGPLTEIAELCRLRGLPPLAALVVRQDAGHPGVGYFRRPDAFKVDLVTDAHLAAWRTDAQTCIDFPRLPRTPPKLTERTRRR